MLHRLRKQTAQHEQCCKYSSDLRNDVKTEVYQRDLSQVEKGERDCRIHVGAGSFTAIVIRQSASTKRATSPASHRYSGQWARDNFHMEICGARRRHLTQY